MSVSNVPSSQYFNQSIKSSYSFEKVETFEKKVKQQYLAILFSRIYEVEEREREGVHVCYGKKMKIYDNNDNDVRFKFVRISVAAASSSSRVRRFCLRDAAIFAISLMVASIF